MSHQEKALLPSGFVDLLPGEAQQEADIITGLCGHFAKFGYQRVKPPLLEFEDSLLAPGPGALLAGDTFRVMDPISHRMMGIRPDITAQIARIVSSRLAKEARPLRLHYANDALRTRGSQLRTERQFCQVGCEIVGGGELALDIEISLVALSGLARAGLEAVTLDLTVPGFTAAMCSAYGIEGDGLETLGKALAQRDREAALKLGGQDFVDILACAGLAEEMMPKLQSLNLPAGLQDKIKGLSLFHEKLNAAISQWGLKGVSVSVDLFEQQGFEYHSDIGFTLFAPGARSELGRGGRYHIGFGENQAVGAGELARGFTLYMDSLRRVLPKASCAPVVYVPFEEDWNILSDLQAQGYITLRGEGGDVARQSALDLGCTHLYEDGAVRQF